MRQFHEIKIFIYILHTCTHTFIHTYKHTCIDSQINRYRVQTHLHTHIFSPWFCFVFWDSRCYIWRCVGFRQVKCEEELRDGLQAVSFMPPLARFCFLDSSADFSYLPSLQLAWWSSKPWRYWMSYPQQVISLESKETFLQTDSSLTLRSSALNLSPDPYLFPWNPERPKSLWGWVSFAVL